MKPICPANPGDPVLQAPVEPGVPLGVLYDVSLNVTVELGRVSSPSRRYCASARAPSSTSPATPAIPSNVLANGKLIARGDPVVVDGMLAVRLTELVSSAAP